MIEGLLDGTVVELELVLGDSESEGARDREGAANGEEVASATGEEGVGAGVETAKASPRMERTHTSWTLLDSPVEDVKPMYA